LKKRAPFNALCLLDPNSGNLYFNGDGQMEEAVRVIKQDTVFNKLRQDQNHNEEHNEDIPVMEAPADDRRSQLLFEKRAREEDSVRRERGDAGTDVVGSKIDEELARLVV
jgi:hypothetical protein